MTHDAPAGLNLWKLILDAHPVSKVVFAILILCSILSIAVIVERMIVINRARKSTKDALDQLDVWAKSGQWQVARDEIGRAVREKSPMFSVLRAGIVYWQQLVGVGETRLEVMEALVSDQVIRELKLVRSMLRSNLPILANITSVAPFIGLFGTVVGIILTFDAISRTGNMGQELVASGIADALVATAMGLFAAIPAVLAYNYFTDNISQVILTMEEAAMERLYFLVQREQVSESTGQPPSLSQALAGAAPAAAIQPGTSIGGRG
jgi:biopolymer transport protein ExbB/TolQ